MTAERDEALSVLRDIWARSDAEPPAITGRGRSCKAMRHIGAESVDDDQRAAWRDRLAREGKLGESTVADLLAER